MVPALLVPLVPPLRVVPQRSPLVAWTSPAKGSLPSGHPLWEQNLCMVVSVAICAGRAIAVVAHRARTAQALVAQFSLLKVLTVRFMVVLLCLVGGPMAPR